MKEDIWLDPDENNNPEPLIHSESSLLVEVACTPMSEETYLLLLENLLMTSIGVEVLGASLPKADLANTTALWLTCQQQRP